MKVTVVSLHWNMSCLSNSWGGGYTRGAGVNRRFLSLVPPHQVLPSQCLFTRLNCIDSAVSLPVPPSISLSIHLFIRLHLTRLTKLTFHYQSSRTIEKRQNNGHRTVTRLWLAVESIHIIPGINSHHLWCAISCLSSHICMTLCLVPSLLSQGKSSRIYIKRK